MSSKPIITVQNLGKKYMLADSRINNSRSMMEELSHWIKGSSTFKTQTQEFWALRDLNFSILPGQTVGIIGTNGSGKSTLLKILARVTWPTTGRIEIHGRVSALLEVGTGFHLELSGRENVFLSGAMLGMKKAEVTRHFDEIVAFSGVERFLDTPVKRYSSGMFLRLAFSIMTHLRSDVLIIDEILAVGDAQFQAKCLERMQALVNEGRTILFVSHQFAKVQSLCDHTLWIKEGCLVDFGPTDGVISRYEEFYGLKSSSLAPILPVV
jgi:lipopolysaccharide transport system ATP-binding protein